MVRVLLELIVILLVTRAFWRLAGGLREGLFGQTRRPSVPRRGVQMVRDPVCGTFVVPTSAFALTEGRRELYFCSSACRDRYRARTA